MPASRRSPINPPLALTLATVLLSPGCHSTAGSQSSTTPATLHLARNAEPTTFDPALVEDGPTIEVLMHVFDGLVQWTPKNELAPALAERWETSPDGRTLTFHLRPGVKFQNGRPLKASDFVYSMNRALRPETHSTVAMTYLNDIAGAADVAAGRAHAAKGLAAPDDLTL